MLYKLSYSDLLVRLYLFHIHSLRKTYTSYLLCDFNISQTFLLGLPNERKSDLENAFFLSSCEIAQITRDLHEILEPMSFLVWLWLCWRHVNWNRTDIYIARFQIALPYATKHCSRVSRLIRVTPDRRLVFIENSHSWVIVVSCNRRKLLWLPCWIQKQSVLLTCCVIHKFVSQVSYLIDVCLIANH